MEDQVGKLHEILKHFFLPSACKRGMQYALWGKVKDITVLDDAIIADVQGNKSYTVDINLERTTRRWTFLAICTCPQNDRSGELCKHIYATLVMLDKRQPDPFGPVPAAILKSGSISLHTEGLDEVLEEEHDEDDEQKDLPAEVPAKRGDVRAAIADAFGAGMLLTASQLGGAFSLRNNSGNGSKTAKNLLPKSVFKFVAPSPPPPLAPLYVLEQNEFTQKELAISFYERAIKDNGKIGPPKRLLMTRAKVATLATPEDQEVCRLLVGAGSTPLKRNAYYNYGYTSADPDDGTKTVEMHKGFWLDVLPRLAATGRLFFNETHMAGNTPLTWKGGDPLELTLRVSPMPPEAGDRLYAAEMVFRRGEEMIPSWDMSLIHEGSPGFCIHDGVIEPALTHGCLAWTKTAEKGRIAKGIRERDLPDFIREVRAKRVYPPIHMPVTPVLRFAEPIAPTPRLELTLRPHPWRTQETAVAAQCFAMYGSDHVNVITRELYVTNNDGALVRRDFGVERGFYARLVAEGFDLTDDARKETKPEKAAQAVVRLLHDGWTVVGDKALYRKAGVPKIAVSSGIDWFEVNGTVDYDGQTASLPDLLAALRRNEQFVKLGDGSLGVLPDEWIAKHRVWLELGEKNGDTVRFAKTQIGLIDALMAEMPEASCDETVRAARKKLREFDGVKPRRETEGFKGELREYQRDGLGWLSFLEEFNFGGCLADDMGLGKTIQMLAHIVEVRSRVNGHAPKAPWLVVAPKSLVFNWMRESAKFSPHLKCLDYTGIERKTRSEELRSADMVFTTYGTMRQDIAQLREVTFDGIVLDEAQCIKNPDSLSAKASRLLKGLRRIAMTGTPVENHLGDLWSIFDFLNPGMLGTVKAFKGFTGSAGGAGKSKEQEEMERRMLKSALRPFILRRSKEQVAKDLPARVEQTIECKLGTKQRKLYNQLRDHYRESVMATVDKKGLNKSKIHVLEALLRLRQAACHPALVDKVSFGAESAKLESLLEMMEDAAGEGRKVLVFSQFTSMLALVRTALDAKGIVYEYLDGQTNDRAARVDRFQNDPKCGAFLISLKAGGFGLNLTAADYVFILDPWWNPAVEAQAIDRAHRIGQTKKVVAYRLIAKDTIEERIAQLQESKRNLAESIIDQTESIVKSLTRDDLMMLLS
mgnify:CR=1 FL=1